MSTFRTVAHIALGACLTAGLWVSAGQLNSQAAGPAVGYVNIQKVTEDFPAYRDAQRKLQDAESKYQAQQQSLEEKYKGEYAKRLKLLEDAHQKGTKPEELKKLSAKYDKEMTNLRASYEKQLAPIQSKGVKLYKDLLDKLRKQIETACGDVARQKQLAMVLDRQAVFSGGVDVTNDVISKLKR